MKDRRKEPAMMKKTTVMLPPDVWRQARIRAAQEDTSYQEIALAAIETYLKQPKKEPKR
jgi:hypothetical protein